MVKLKKILTMFSFVWALLVSGDATLGDGLSMVRKSKENNIYTECEGRKRIYKPRYSSSHRDFSYELIIDKVDVSGKTWGKYADVSLNTYGALDSALSTLNMSYGCSGGSMISCNVGFSNKKNEADKFDTVSFDIVSLDKAFNQVDVLATPAPYVVILPRINVRLKYIDWKNFSGKMQYHTEEKITPSGGLPELWFLERCE